MKRHLLIMCLSYALCLLMFFSCSPKPNKMDKLKTQIQQKLATTKGEFAVAYKSLDNPTDTLFINANTNFHAASTTQAQKHLPKFPK